MPPPNYSNQEGRDVGVGQLIRWIYENESWLRPYLEDLNQLAHDRSGDCAMAETTAELTALRLTYRSQRNAYVVDGGKRLMFETAVHAGLIAGGNEAISFVTSQQLFSPNGGTLLAIIAVAMIARRMVRKR